MIIEIKKLTKIYDHNPVVNNFNLSIKEGELLSLLGVNGAGKTTTIKMLTGLIAKTSGDIFIEGKDFSKNSNDIKSIMNVSPQETAIAPNLSVRENLDFIGGVYEIKNKKETIDELIKQFKLDEVEQKKAKKLSGGWQRRLSIAMSLINNPKILFLDEPTLGLDVIARKELWNIIEKLKGKMTIILTTHYMEEAEKLSDKIGIMNKGELIEVGTVKQLISKTKSKNLEDAFIELVSGGQK